MFDDVIKLIVGLIIVGVILFDKLVKLIVIFDFIFVII